MTLGSLFDGIGGFPLAAQSCGIEPLWASEIEPSCIEITRRHFPNMIHLGSVTDINGAAIPPVDIISFGSPCQDLSIAGKQTGLDGERSGLFMEAVRIIKEMRCATNGRYPAYAIWENVPGAYSSNKGEDFRRVIEALSESEIPMPRSGKWAESGLVRVSDRELAWRTFDAQYWGVPQRRKRIYLVTDFRGRSAGEILFKPESMLGYTPQGRKEGQETPAAAGGGIKSAGFIDRAPAGAGSIGFQEEMCPTLRAGLLPSVMCAGFSGQNSVTATLEFYPECAPCLRVGVKPNCLQGVFEMSHANEVLRKSDGDICPTLQSRMGTGGNQVPIVFCKATRPHSADEAQKWVMANVSPTLNAFDTGEARADVIVAQPSYCIAGNIVDRSETAGANGVGAKEDCSYTLNTVDHHAVAYSFMPQQKAEATGFSKEVSCCLVNGTNPGYQNAVAYCIDCRNLSANCELYHTLQSKPGGGWSLNYLGCLFYRWIVRRLTPRECERLQGFPDDWTIYDTKGLEIKDSPRYRALGNSIAVPCAVRVFRGILSL